MKYQDVLGRQFELSVYDCFTIVRDLYIENFGIKMRKYARPRDWNSDELDIIGLSYEQEGFDKVSDWTLKTLQPGDLLCMAIGTSKPNHLAVFVGENTIVHHKINAMSNAEMLRDFWRNSICYVLRHKDVENQTVEKPSVNIQDIIDARNSLQVEA